MSCSIVCLLTGVDAEGIYRLSGKTNDILRIKKEFDHSELINMSALRLFDNCESRMSLSIHAESNFGISNNYKSSLTTTHVVESCCW